MVEIANNLPYPKGRFDKADPKGGITLRDDSNMISNVLKDIAKTFVSNVIKGNVGDAMRLRTPAYIHSPITYLDCIRYEFSCLESMLYIMKEKDLLDDPVERIKLITCA